MDRSIVATTNAFLGQDYWEFFSNPSSSPELVVAMMREMMLEIWFYQRSINESILHAIGRKGRLIDEHPIVQAMLAVQLGNTDDGAIALEDYVTLGGDRDSAINQRPSPSALVLMGTVNYLAEHADPLCCLGCLYFLEKSAEITIAAVEPVLARAGYPRQRLRFLQSHLNKKVSRVSLLVDVIASCEEKYDHAAESIYYGFQCLGQVYPHPLWNSAFERAVGTDS
jgi:hypothetical protein